MFKHDEDPIPFKLIYKNVINSEGEQVDNLVLLPGGKEPPSTGSTWLNELEVGSVFLIRDKHTQDFNLGLFKLVGWEGISNKICVLASQDIPKPLYVDPVRFCNKFMLYDTLAVIKEEEEEEILKD